MRAKPFRFFWKTKANGGVNQSITGQIMPNTLFVIRIWGRNEKKTTELKWGGVGGGTGVDAGRVLGLIGVGK